MKEPGTPLPWCNHHSFNQHIMSGSPRYDNGGVFVAATAGENEDQDAAYILEACNEYPKLVEALMQCVKAIKAKEWDQSHQPVSWGKNTCSSCGGTVYLSHYAGCRYASALTNAEELLEGYRN